MSVRPGKLVEGQNEIDLSGDGGLIKTIVKEGSGEVIPTMHLASVHYTGKLLNGTVFDSSRKRGQPFQFKVGSGQVILGWDTGVRSMRKGEQCILKCSPNYAYGKNGLGPIPGNATLIFEIELLDWDKGSNDELPLLYKLVLLLTLIFALGWTFYRVYYS